MDCNITSLYGPIHGVEQGRCTLLRIDSVYARRANLESSSDSHRQCSPLCLSNPSGVTSEGARVSVLCNILPSLRPVGHEDAKAEPDGRCRVATDDIAKVMCAEVDPAEPDEQDQDRKYGNGGSPWKIGPRYPGK